MALHGGPWAAAGGSCVWAGLASEGLLAGLAFEGWASLCRV